MTHPLGYLLEKVLRNMGGYISSWAVKAMLLQTGIMFQKLVFKIWKLFLSTSSWRMPPFKIPYVRSVTSSSGIFP